MTLKQLLIVLLLNIYTLSIVATCTKGIVIDKTTGQGIALASIKIKGTNTGATTDTQGHFEICGSKSKITIIEISHIAYQTQTISIKPEEQVITIILETKEVQAEEVVISGNGKGQINNTFAGKQQLSRKDVLGLPTFLGETDVIKAVQLLPGVQSVSEGNSGVFVRGGSAGQNLFLLDDMELMNPSHLMGIYSVFNPLTSESIEVHKGHSPVNLQGRLSSTIAVKSRIPTKENSGLEGNIGNISSNLVWSGISKDDKFSIIAGVRRSYIEGIALMASAFLDDDDNYFKTNKYAFFDFNGKMSYRLTPKTSLSLSWYTGNDNFKFNNNNINYHAGTDWGNNCASLVLKTTLRSDDMLIHSLQYTSTYSGFSGNILDNYINFDSKYNQLQQKNQWIHQGSHQLINAGIDFSLTQTTPQDLFYYYLSDTISKTDQFKNLSTSAYIGDKVTISNKMDIYVGLRLTTDLSLGPYNYQNTLTESISYNNNEISKAYYSWSPVVALSIYPSDGKSIKTAFSRNIQQVHLASMSSIPLPNDLWVTSSPLIKPEVSYQLSAGYYQHGSKFDWSAEIYGKYLENQLLYNVNISKDQSNFEDNFHKGKGIAYGMDCSVTKTKGIVTGSINYSLAHSQRSFPNIYNGVWFNDKYDRIHDLNIQATYPINKKWDIGAVWVFATGNNMTLPTGRWWMMGSVMNDYTGYNNFRLPPYHRLDISVNRVITSKIFKESILNFSIINIYNRSNPYFLFYKVYMGNSQYNIDVRATQVSLFPIMPSVSWRFKF